MDTYRPSIDEVLTPRKEVPFVESTDETSFQQSSTPTTCWSKTVALYNNGGIPLILLCTAIGVGIGLWMSYAETDPTIVSWIELPGELYLRGLKCLVIPLIFCSMSLGVGEISSSTEHGSSRVGIYAVGIYIFTTILGSIEGIVMVVSFRHLFSVIAKEENLEIPYVALQCENGNYLQTFDNGTIQCSLSNTTSSILPSSQFQLYDVNNLLLNSAQNTMEKRTISGTLQNLFRTLITDNIVQAAAYPTVLSIVMFSIAFGYGISKVRVEVNEKNYMLVFVRQLNDVVMALIDILIGLTPLAIIFLVAGAIAKERDLSSLFSNVAVLILMVFLGLAIHMFISLPALFFAVTKSNPFSYMKHCIPAVTFAFACSSSIGTLPVTMKCVEATKQVTTSIARFVLSFGATINMDGAAIYYPAAIVFVAEISGHGSELDAGTMVTLVVASTIGAVGASPIPTPGLVNVLMIWQATFPHIPVPPQIAFLQAIDWLNDRGCTMTNIFGDALVARMVQELVSRKETTEIQNKESIYLRESNCNA